VGSQIILDPELEGNIVTDRERATEVFNASLLLLIDDIDWDADFAVIVQAVGKRRAFKGRSRARAERGSTARARPPAHADRLFAELYPASRPGRAVIRSGR
jgi:hypothetical protein